MIKIGDKDIKKIYVGDKPVKKVMLGDKQIWPAEQLTAPADDPIWFDRKFWMKNTENTNYDDFYIKPAWFERNGTGFIFKFEQAIVKEDAKREVWAFFNAWNPNARKGSAMRCTGWGFNGGETASYNTDRFDLYYSETLQLWILDQWKRTLYKETFPICFTEKQCADIQPYIGGQGPE